MRHAAPAPIVAAESTLLARGGIPGLVEAELELGGTRVAGPVFTTTATPADPADPGLSESADEVLRTALQFDASGLPTGSYPYRFVSTGNFGCTRVSSATAGRVFVRNETDSPFGAGWTLDELQRLFPQDDGSLVLTEGDGTTLRFEAFQPPAEVPLSDLKKLSKGDVKKLKEGGENPEKIKREVGASSKQDVYKDQEGNLYVGNLNGAGVGEFTGLNINNF